MGRFCFLPKIKCFLYRSPLGPLNHFWVGWAGVLKCLAFSFSSWRLFLLCQKRCQSRCLGGEVPEAKQKQQNSETLKNQVFHDFFFSQFRLKLGRSGGVRGDGADHTKTLSRTLARFGLTGHGGSRFSCFLRILETHFITKYPQICPRASRLVLGLFLKGYHLRSYQINGFS